MSEYDVMILAGHSSFATTHKFYLAVADDLVRRARVATARGMRQKLVRFGTRALEEVTWKKAGSHKGLPAKDLQMGRGEFEPPTHVFSVQQRIL